jgi:hypothetical protein
MSDDEDHMDGSRYEMHDHGHAGEADEHEHESHGESEVSDDLYDRTIYESFMRRGEDLDRIDSVSSDRIHSIRKRKLLSYISEMNMYIATIKRNAYITRKDVCNLTMTRSVYCADVYRHL